MRIRAIICCLFVMVGLLIHQNPVGTHANRDEETLLKEGPTWPVEYSSAVMVDADLFYMFGVKYDRRHPFPPLTSFIYDGSRISMAKAMLICYPLPSRRHSVISVFVLGGLAEWLKAAVC